MPEKLLEYWEGIDVGGADLPPLTAAATAATGCAPVDARRGGGDGTIYRGSPK